MEVSGFGSHASGHLNLLKLKDQIYPGGESKKHWPTLGMNTLRWAKKQGGITGPAHSANGLTRFVGRIEEVEDGPNGLPNFNIPAFDGIGANEYIVDATHMVPGPDGKPVPALDFISAMDTDRVAEWNMWYHTLNCGYRIRVSGETDFPCISGDRVGMGRVYVKVPGKLDFDRWVDGIQEGRSSVSDGTTHLMDFKVNYPLNRQRRCSLFLSPGCRLQTWQKNRATRTNYQWQSRPNQGDPSRWQFAKSAIPHPHQREFLGCTAGVPRSAHQPLLCAGE